MKKFILFILIMVTLTSCNNKNLNPQVTDSQVTDSQVKDSQNQISSVNVSKEVDNKDDTLEIKNKMVVADTSNVKAKADESKVIVIDPGHANKSNLEKEASAPASSIMKIKDGGGAEGIVTKTPEYLINMNVALKLRELLQQRGYTIVMTKTDNSVSLGNIDRAEIGNRANAALVIRIHADSNDNTSVKGVSMLVPKAINNNTKAIYEESLRCGEIVLNTFTSELNMVNRGVTPHDDMTGFNWSKVPVILVEMGFLSNASEDKLLSDDTYQSKLAKALADGISNCIK